MNERYVIVGSGAAGIAAAEQIRTIDPDGSLTLVNMEQDGYYSRPGLAYLLNGEIPEKQLYPLDKCDLDALNISLVFDVVLELDFPRKMIVLRKAGQLNYDRLLLAMGAKAALPDVEGIDLEGVVKLDTLTDARHILRLARRARKAVVVGGGITALELAEGLAARGVETHYLLRRDRYWPSVLDEAESELVEARLEHEGVRLHRETGLKRVIGRKGKVRSIETNAGEEIVCQILAVAIGIHPRVSLAQRAGLKVERGILVDEFMHTSAEAVFAAGDVAQVFDPQRGAYVLDSLWGPAVEQGRTAGANMVGERRTYRKTTAMNVTRIGGLTTTIIGSLGDGEDDPDLLAIARGDSEAWRKAPEAFAVKEDHEANRIRLMITEGAIIGALVMGNQRLSQPLQDLVTNHVNIQPIMDQLSRSDTSLEEVLFPFWDQWRGARDAFES